MRGSRDFEKRLRRLEARHAAARKAQSSSQAREELLARLADLRERMDRADPCRRERLASENEQTVRALFERLGIRVVAAPGD